LPFYRVHRKDTKATWAKRWEAKCEKQIGRIRNTYENGIGGQGVHSCESYVEGYVVPEFPADRTPPARSPCTALTFVTDNFQVFMARFLNVTNGHCRARFMELNQRQGKWKDILLSRANCDSYLYKDASNVWHKMSDVCVADFVDGEDHDCQYYAHNTLCGTETPEFYLANTEDSVNGDVVGLNCPQCGCINRPTQLYDVPER
jgi:hypothetical protein